MGLPVLIPTNRNDEHPWSENWDSQLWREITTINTCQIILLLQYCRFLIKGQDLISALNWEKCFFWILKSGFYFSDTCELYETIIKLLCSRFYILAIWHNTEESQNFAPKYNKESSVIQLHCSHNLKQILPCLYVILRCDKNPLITTSFYFTTNYIPKYNFQVYLLKN